MPCLLHHTQLSSACQLVWPAGDDRLGVISYLREQSEVAEARAALTEAECKRWQQQTAVAERSARQLQAQMDSMRQQSSQTPQLASQQEALVQSQDQIRLLTQANQSFRLASETIDLGLGSLPHSSLRIAASGCCFKYMIVPAGARHVCSAL